MLAGMLLLGFAGVLVATVPSHTLEEMQTQGRRLQVTVTATPAPAEVSPAGFFGIGWGSSFGSLLISICFAFLYKKNTVDKIVAEKGTLSDRKIPETGDDDFENGICECFDDIWVCIHGLFCPIVRMAHTNEVSGILGFWPTVAAWFCCQVLTGGIGNCCMMVYWRKQLKGIMGIDDNLLCDVFVTCVCPNLSVCQSATAVDRALGYEVVGCCDLEWTEDVA
jgi:Cys-rich protein (TIGR01571 family)